MAIFSHLTQDSLTFNPDFTEDPGKSRILGEGLAPLFSSCYNLAMFTGHTGIDHEIFGPGVRRKEGDHHVQEP